MNRRRGPIGYGTPFINPTAPISQLTRYYYYLLSLGPRQSMRYCLYQIIYKESKSLLFTRALFISFEECRHLSNPVVKVLLHTQRLNWRMLVGIKIRMLILSLGRGTCAESFSPSSPVVDVSGKLSFHYLFSHHPHSSYVLLQSPNN